MKRWQRLPIGPDSWEWDQRALYALWWDLVSAETDPHAITTPLLTLKSHVERPYWPERIMSSLLDCMSLPPGGLLTIRA